MENILVVDDEKEIADLIELYLMNENYRVYKFYSSDNILEFLSTNSIDLAILDVMLSNMNGFELCRKIREKYHFPIIFLTAKIDETDKLDGFAFGADDYITKPFRSLDLLARVKSQIRRYKVYSKESKESENAITLREIRISKEKHEMRLNDKKINLTPIEFEIVWYLCKNSGRVVTNDELYKEVWKEKYYDNDNNTIMVHIRHIREKMNDVGKKAKYIITIWGVGYEIEK